jgi:hypothetical protein
MTMRDTNFPHIDPGNISTGFDNPELTPKERDRALNRSVAGLILWAREEHKQNRLDDDKYAQLLAVLEYVRFGKTVWKVGKATFPVFVGLAFLITKWDALIRFAKELFQ